MNRRQLLAATLAASAALYQRPSSAQPPSTPFDFQLSLDFSKIQVNPVGNRFSLELFRVLSDVNRNCIASPLSVLVPMALLAQAAGGNTRSQLRDALHLGDQDDSALRLAGAHRGVERSQTVQCKIANALYVQEGTDLQGDFLQLAKDSFGAEVQPAGFKTNHEAVRQEINRWVDQRTGGKTASQQPVTVRMTVESCHSVLPDGKHFRLVSERNFQHEDAFVVHLSDQVVKQFGGHDLNRWFQGKTIRVTGVVEPIVFSSIAETRPGIRVVDVKMLEIEISEAVTEGWPEQLDPPLFGSPVLRNQASETWHGQGIE